MPSPARERAGAGEVFDRAPRWMIARAIGAVVVPVSIAMALCVWLVTLLRDDASQEVVSGSVVSAVYTETVRRWFGFDRTMRATGELDDADAREGERKGDDCADAPGCWRTGRARGRDDDDDARGRRLTESFSRTIQRVGE